MHEDHAGPGRGAAGEGHDGHEVAHEDGGHRAGPARAPRPRRARAPGGALRLGSRCQGAAAATPGTRAVILVDTSVWIDFLAGRPAAAALKALLLADDVACHPAVRGEVALGNLAHRERVLALLAGLPRAAAVDDEQV